MEQRTVVLEVVSATNIKKVYSLPKQDAYAIAYVSTSPRVWKSTSTDTKGNLNPVWNSTLTFTVDEELRKQDRADIILEVHCQSDSESSNLLGEAKIPLNNLPEGTSSPRYQGYDLLRPSGKTCGVITVSVKLGEKKTLQDERGQGRGVQDSRDEPVMAYPANPSYNSGPQMPQQPYGYGYPQQAYGYPQQPPPYGYAPHPYGYPPPPPPPYGYAPPPPPPYAYPQQAPSSRFGGGGLGGAGLGLGAGLLGGLLVGDMLGDMGDGGGDYGGGDYGGGDGGGDFGGGDF